MYTHAYTYLTQCIYTHTLKCSSISFGYAIYLYRKTKEPNGVGRYLNVTVQGLIGSRATQGLVWVAKLAFYIKIVGTVLKWKSPLKQDSRGTMEAYCQVAEKRKKEKRDIKWIGLEPTHGWRFGEVKRDRCWKLAKPALGVILGKLTKEKLKSPWIPMEL